MKNDKTTRLTSVRKPDGKLTETPEKTLNELTKHHFKDNTNISTFFYIFFIIFIYLNWSYFNSAVKSIIVYFY